MGARGPVSETAMVRLLRAHLGSRRFDIQRVETPVGVGVPDLNYCILGAEGWLELKAWHRKTNRGPFRIPTIRSAQVAWLRKRREAGGRAYIMCNLNSDIILFDGVDAPDLNFGVKWSQAREMSLAWLEKPYDFEKLVEALTAPPPQVSSENL